jgi:sirohydrochlorin cobaltochelatase
MNHPNPAPKGLIMLAHGARDERWSLPFEQVAAAVRLARPDAVVALAYLEFMAPDLVGAGAQLAAAGCREVQVLPLFLGAGGHVRKDVPRLMQALKDSHADVHWALGTAVGERAALVQALAHIGIQQLDGAPT